MDVNSFSRVACDSNGIRTHKHLVRKRTLNHLAKPLLVFRKRVAMSVFN